MTTKSINQEELAETLYKEFLGYSLSTDPVDKQHLEPFYKQAYKIIASKVTGNPRFTKVIWVKSPLAACYLYTAYEQFGTREMNRIAAFLEKTPDIMQIKPANLFKSKVNIDFPKCFRACSMGGWESYWVGHFTFTEQVNNTYDDDVKKRLSLLREFCKGHMWWAIPGYVIASDRPIQINRDDQNRLHSTNGAAIRYPDGFRFYYVDGIHVKEHVVEKPASITLEEIKEESNAAVRRVLLQQYGLRRYLRDTGATLLDKRPNEWLYHDTTEDRKWLICSDGSTGAIYNIFVPNTTAKGKPLVTCAQAQAALSGVDESYALARS